MIIILWLKNYQTNLRGNLSILGKTKKNTKLALFQQKRNCIIKFTDSTIFMMTSLSSLADNLAEQFHKTKCNDSDCFFEYRSVKDNLIKYKCWSYNKDYSNKFSINDINKFILLLRKGVFILVNIWMIGKILMKQHYLKTKKTYSRLSMEHTADVITCK